MLAMSMNAYLLVVWCLFAALGIVAAAAVLVWAARSGQFRDQRRLAGLALESYIPDDEQLAQERLAATTGGAGESPAETDPCPPGQAKEQQQCST